MLIKDNISKLSGLNFSNKFEFKPLGLFHTLTVPAPTKKGKKKGKKKK